MLTILQTLPIMSFAPPEAHQQFQVSHTSILAVLRCFVDGLEWWKGVYQEKKRHRNG